MNLGLGIDAGGTRTRWAVTTGDGTLFGAGPSQTTLPRQTFTGMRENIGPTIAALATILIIFFAGLLLALERLRGRNKAAAKF